MVNLSPARSMCFILLNSAIEVEGDEDQEMPPFSYKPLKDGEIRVLSFENQDDTSETIRLSMSHISRKAPVTEKGKEVSMSLGVVPSVFDHALTGSIVTKPVYFALSYTWGRSLANNLVILNNRKFYVNSNLEIALRNLRKHRNSYSIEPIWIDAISINQSDNEEKCAQVLLMKEIYEDATQVIVWLGEEREGTTQLAVDLLNNHVKINGFTASIPDYSDYSAAWQAFGGDLMKRDWWKRMWVIQEIAVSWRTSPMVMCGPYAFSWARLAVAAHYAETSDLPIFNHTEEEIAIGYVYLPTIRWKSAYRKRLSRGQPLPLLEMMMNNISCEAMDPRDKVYSLLGIATDIKSVPVASKKNSDTVTPTPSSSSSIELICDYKKSVGEVYTDFVRVHATTHKSLDVICFTRHEVERSEESMNLPSWVPDWNILWRTGSLQLTRTPFLEPGLIPQYVYDASLGVDPDFEFFDSDSLLASGTFFDTVKNVGQPYLDSNPPGKAFYYRLQGWRQIALGTEFESASHPYIGGGNMLDAFKRTITCDQGRYGERVKVDRNLFDPDACFVDYGDAIFADPTDPLVGDQVYSLFTHYRLDTTSPSFKNAQRAVYLRTQRRRFFITEKGYFGLGTADTETGDGVFVLSGCSVPVILRKSPESVAKLVGDKMFGECWNLVGESFVTGIMDGEVVKKGGKFERLLLR